MTVQKSYSRLGDLAVRGAGFLSQLLRVEQDLTRKAAKDDIEHAHGFVDAFAEMTGRKRESTPAQFPEP